MAAGEYGNSIWDVESHYSYHVENAFRMIWLGSLVGREELPGRARALLLLSDVYHPHRKLLQSQWVGAIQTETDVLTVNKSSFLRKSHRCCHKED